MQSLDRVHQSDLRLDLESLGRNPGIGVLTGIPGYSVHFIKFEGYFSCQWNVNSWQLLPPSFIIHLSLVPDEVRSSEKLPPPQDQERLSLQDKSQAGSARPPYPHLIAPLREKSSGFKTRKMQCVRLSMNITLKDATTGKPKLRCWKARRRKCGREALLFADCSPRSRRHSKDFRYVSLPKQVSPRNCFFRSVWPHKLRSLHLTAGAASRAVSTSLLCAHLQPTILKHLGLRKGKLRNTFRNVFTISSFHISCSFSSLRLCEFTENPDFLHFNQFTSVPSAGGGVTPLYY